MQLVQTPAAPSTAMCRFCRLADFGLSRMLDLNKTHVSTQTYGTLPFMPVELLSEGHMGKSADVSVSSTACFAAHVMLQGPLYGTQLRPRHGCLTAAVPVLVLTVSSPRTLQVYSFAVVMWSLMTGDQPHHGMNTMQVRPLRDHSSCPQRRPL
jgi:serine/threonine protein kinase